MAKRIHTNLRWSCPLIRIITRGFVYGACTCRGKFLTKNERCERAVNYLIDRPILAKLVSDLPTRPFSSNKIVQAQKGMSWGDSQNKDPGACFSLLFLAGWKTPNQLSSGFQIQYIQDYPFDWTNKDLLSRRSKHCCEWEQPIREVHVQRTNARNFRGTDHTTRYSRVEKWINWGLPKGNWIMRAVGIREVPLWQRISKLEQSSCARRSWKGRGWGYQTARFYKTSSSETWASLRIRCNRCTGRQFIWRIRGKPRPRSDRAR